MNFVDLKEICRNSWEEEHNYFCIDRSKKRDQGRCCFCNKSKIAYIEGAPETKAFSLT